jgi:hypothetical protein
MTMTASRVAAPQIFAVPIEAPRGLVTPLAGAAIFFALQQTGLGFLDYLPLPVTRVLQALLAGSTLLLAFIGLVDVFQLPRFHRRVILSVTALNLFYMAMSLAFGGVRPIFPLESAVFALAMVPVIRDSRVWLRLTRLMFWMIVILIALNMVTLVHWAGWVDLPNEYIVRLVDTGEDLSYHDPLSFGLFGRTENQAIVGRFHARLQGWALEPLHWAYFVAIALAFGFFLRRIAPTAKSRRRYSLALILIAAHLYFVNSASATVTIAAWLGCMASLIVIYLFGPLRRRAGGLLFIAAALGTGFLIPFALAMIPDIDYWFETEDVTGEQGNWKGKVDFLALGAGLFTRFLPIAGSELQASHNLLLEKYLHYGYFLVAPLLVFLYRFVRTGVSAGSAPMSAMTLLILLTHTLLVPSAMFYPGGALCFILGFTAADYYRVHTAAEVAHA